MRAFSDEEVIHVEGEVDPVRDLAIIHEELRLKDQQFLERHLDAAKKALRCHENDKARKFDLVRNSHAYCFSLKLCVGNHPKGL